MRYILLRIREKCIGSGRNRLKTAFVDNSMGRTENYERLSQSRRGELSVAHCEHSRRPFTDRDRRNVEKGQNTSTKTD
jgi:hypothetical protein